MVSEQVIRAVEPYHAQLINKIRYGDMLLPGESLLIMETEPAGYIAFACNEAVKAAHVKLLDAQLFVLHFSGTRVSGGSKPFTPGTTGPDQMPAYGYDDSEEGRKWFKDKCGITLTADDVAVHCGNTWGTNWRGECADIYWPPHWGPKTSGSWICSAKWMLANLSLDMVYFPDAFPGIPGDPLPPQPTDPKWEGAVYAEQMPSGLIAIRGEMVCDGKAAIIVPDGAGRYRPVPKPVL